MTKNPTIVLARKELASLINAPATYVISIIFLLTTGWLFVSTLFINNQSSLDGFAGSLPLIFTFLIPALTMKAFAEEFKGGTIEYLASLPLTDAQLVLGKYAASMGLVSLLMMFTLLYPAVLFVIGRPDPGQLFGVYVAILGLASFFVSIGIWASSLTRNQVVAFIVGFFVCFIFFLLGRIADFLPGSLAPWLRSLSVEEHFGALARGVLDTRDLLYWASGTFFFLIATLSMVQTRKWK